MCKTKGQGNNKSGCEKYICAFSCFPYQPANGPKPYAGQNLANELALHGLKNIGTGYEHVTWDGPKSDFDSNAIRPTVDANFGLAGVGGVYFMLFGYIVIY